MEESDLKQLERRARSLLMTKQIPPAKMDIVRSLMNNPEIMPHERYRTIIGLVESCLDREAQKTVLGSNVKQTGALRRKPKLNSVQEAGVNGDYYPTETSLYIDRLYAEYRSARLFKKRYLTRRNNRLGIGLRKRLVPSPGLLKVLKTVADVQREASGKLAAVLALILKDEQVTSPVLYNYIRVLRSWLLASTMPQLKYKEIKWMERPYFDREFTPWAERYFAFQEIDTEQRESIIREIDLRLRELDDFRKEDFTDSDTDFTRQEKQKRNLIKEKAVYGIVMSIRSFLHGPSDEGSILSDRIRSLCGLSGVRELVMAVIRALVYQRPVEYADFRKRSALGPPEISREAWDCNPEMLKKAGKDPESVRRREAEQLKIRLQPFDHFIKILRVKDSGQSILMRGVDTQIREVDKNRYNSHELYENNYIAFIDASLHFFKKFLLRYIDGTALLFEDKNGKSYETSPFRRELFADVLAAMPAVLDMFHSFRANNPMTAVSAIEARKIMQGQITTMGHVRELLNKAGDFFFGVSVELYRVYEKHRTYIFRVAIAEAGLARRTAGGDEFAESAEPRPIPFYDCKAVSAGPGEMLYARLKGRPFAGTPSAEGIFGYVMAYCFQGAEACFSCELSRLMSEREAIIIRLGELGVNP